MVGGSPTNISIGATRLGLRTIAFTGVGDDPVGDFILDYLAVEGVVIDGVDNGQFPCLLQTWRRGRGITSDGPTG
jgi:sugar/nucleoside kinase (ribokinase family)